VVSKEGKSVHKAPQYKMGREKEAGGCPKRALGLGNKVERSGRGRYHITHAHRGRQVQIQTKTDFQALTQKPCRSW